MTTTEEEVVAPEEETVDMEKVAELVASLTVAELVPVIEDSGPNKLAALKEAEMAGKNRAGVLQAIAAREDAIQYGEQVPDEAGAPGEELLTLIEVGFWVRLKAGKGIPEHFVGREGVVTFAPVKESQGDDGFSPVPYRFQDGSEEFTIKLRDTGGFITATRKEFIAFASEQALLNRSLGPVDAQSEM